MNQNNQIRNNRQLPLILPFELQSKSSDSTDIDANSHRLFLPPNLISPLWNVPTQSALPYSSFLMKSGAPRIFAPQSQSPEMLHKKQMMETHNDHLLDFPEFVKHNNFGLQQKRKVYQIRCKNNCMHSVVVWRKKENEVLYQFVDNQVKNSKVSVPRSQVDKSNIIVDFLQFLANHKNATNMVNLFSGRLKSRNGFQCQINYENIRNCMMDFFKNKPLKDSLEQLNDFEYLYVGIFILKKNFNDWSIENLDLKLLQNSETKKRKEHFLKFILKKLFKYLNNQKLEFFGEQNEEIIEQMKSIFFEGSNRKGFKGPTSNRMENLGKILSKNVAFKKFYESTNMDGIISDLFQEYSKKPMDTLINNHINRLRSDMEACLDPHKRVNHFVKMIIRLKKKKLKNMWTFREFKQALEVLDYIMSSN